MDELPKGTPIEILGAKAGIRIKFHDFHSLVAELSDSLEAPSLEVTTRETPPYDTVASGSAMGFSLWLEIDEESNPDFPYLFYIETMDSLEERANNQMLDLSPWLARIVSRTSGLEALVEGTSVVFIKGESVVIE